MNEPSRRALGRLGRTLAVLAGLLLVGQVLYADRTVLGDVVHRKLDGWAVAAGTLCQLSNQVLAILRWFLLVRAIGIPLRFGKAVELGVLGECGHIVMPGANGGDLLKAGVILRMQVPRTQLIASTVVDRVAGLMGLLLVGCVAGALGWNSADELVRRLAVVLWSVAAAAALVGAAALHSLAPRLLRNAARWLPVLRGVFEQLELAALAYRRRWRWLLLALMMSFVSQTLCQLAFYFAGRAMFHEAMSSVSRTLLITPILFVTSALPLPFGALGVPEQIGERAFRSLGQPGGGLNMLGYRLIHGLAIILMAAGYGTVWLARRLRPGAVPPSELDSATEEPRVAERSLGCPASLIGSSPPSPAPGDAGASPAQRPG